MKLQATWPADCSMLYYMYICYMFPEFGATGLPFEHFQVFKVF